MLTKMKDDLKRIIKYVACFFTVLLIGNILLYISCSIPSELLYKHIVESKDTLLDEGVFYKFIPPFSVMNNTSTDAVIINEAYSVDNENQFESYMLARKNYNKELTTNIKNENVGEGITANYNTETKKEEVDDNYFSVGELADFLDGKITTSIKYGRYWHGYLIIYRPLLIIFNISQIRMIQLFVFVSLLVFLSVILYKNKGAKIALTYVISLICGGFLSASYSLESASVFVIMMIALIIISIRRDKIKDIYLFFMIVGCVTNFFDYLTVPIITLFVPLSLYMLDYKKNKNLKECFIFIFKTCFAWGTGYAGTWILKWALYDLLINDGYSMLNVGFSQSFYRMTRSNVKSNMGPYELFSNIMHHFLRQTMVIIIMQLVLKLINEKGKDKHVKNNKLMNKIKSQNSIYLLMAMAPLAWWLALLNHTLLHLFFTYRCVVIYTICILLFIHETKADE